jgi:limonene-1,2-epoxide hydrolase
MELTHVRAFTDAMQHKDLEAMLSHMTEDIVLETPLVAEPVRGKAAIRTVVGALLAIVDSFDFQELMQGPSHVASFFVVRIGAERLDGMDYWLLDAAGKIARMKVLWRPLPAIAAVQRRLDAGSDATVAS